MSKYINLFCLLGGNNSVVECDLAKVEVAGSTPVSRSTPSPISLMDLLSHSSPAFSSTISMCLNCCDPIFDFFFLEAWYFFLKNKKDKGAAFCQSRASNTPWSGWTLKEFKRSPASKTDLNLFPCPLLNRTMQALPQAGFGWSPQARITMEPKRQRQRCPQTIQGIKKRWVCL